MLALFLSGCVVVLEPNRGHYEEPRDRDPHTAYEHTIWIEAAYVECGPLGWSFDVYVGSSYFYDTGEVEVGAYADGWDYYPLFHTGSDRWTALHESYHYNCDDIVSFVIVASDDYGSSDTVTLWW